MKKTRIFTILGVIGTLILGGGIGRASAPQVALQSHDEDAVILQLPAEVPVLVLQNGTQIFNSEETPTDEPIATSTDEPTATITPSDTATEQLSNTPTDEPTSTHTHTATNTASITSSITASATASMTATRTPTFTASPSITATVTPSRTPTVVLTPTTIPGTNIPIFFGAPLCPGGAHDDPLHDKSQFHTLWDSSRGCHYDHEHGKDPFTPAVAAAFPGFDLRQLTGGVGVGHTNPSSPMENTHKHGGFKWDVNLNSGNGGRGICRQGFEDGTITVKAYAIQFHAFGRQDIEHEARNHSSTALMSFCKDGNPNDLGYMYVVQLQEYGQRVMPYQGMVMDYPDNFQPEYVSPRGPYFTTECFGQSTTWVDPADPRFTRQVGCRGSFSDGNNNLSIWTSKPTFSSGSDLRPQTPLLFRMLFRSRDNYQRADVRDLVHPFTWMFVCGGTNYNPAGCRHNSSTFTLHEVMGDIPTAWDGLAGFDTDPRPGRITAQGFVTRFGELNLSCTTAGGDCYPIKLVSMFVGRYSSELSVNKVSNPTPENTPERDIYFCRVNATTIIQCSETSPGAFPSGWIGPNN